MISSEFFKEFTSLLPKNLQKQFIDIVSITSGGINPKGNLRLSIGVISELYRKVPVRTGFKMQKSLNKYLLADNTIDTQKFGNFTGTMKLLGGLETKIPSTTNDLLVLFKTNELCDYIISIGVIHPIKNPIDVMKNVYKNQVIIVTMWKMKAI